MPRHLGLFLVPEDDAATTERALMAFWAALSTPLCLEVRSPLLELARESPLRSLPPTDRDVLARSGPLVRREWARSPTSIEPVPALQGARYTSRAVCSDCGVFLSISSHARRQACNQSTLRGP